MTRSAGDAAHKFFRTERCAEARRRTLEARAGGKSLGVVMTMGALHAGHLSLVERSVRECDWTAVTIFVNPTQFGPDEDFTSYPRHLEDDLQQLAGTGVDLVFTPQAATMYRPAHSTFVDPPKIGEPWEGQCRPGHFRGVTTVVLKLLQWIPADVAYFGQKDYQQYLVLRAMAEDLDLPVEMRVCPIVRESDGLAMSSRNAYLDADQRRRALALSQSLMAASEQVAKGVTRASVLATRIRACLTEAGVSRIDYVAVADPDTLQEVREVAGRTLLAVAAHVDQVRLIDNLFVDTA